MYAHICPLTNSIRAKSSASCKCSGNVYMRPIDIVVNECDYEALTAWLNTNRGQEQIERAKHHWKEVYPVRLPMAGRYNT